MMWSSARKLKINFLLIVIEALILLPQSALDPNPLHDGIMFGAAVAVRDGLIPNRDVFAQYGPLAPYIQGYWLKLTGAHLINLRILTAAVLIVVGLLLYSILSVYIKQSLSFVLTILWCISTPRWILPPNLPWASVITTLFALVSMYLFIKIRNSHSDKLKSILTIIASVLIILGGTARIHLFVTYLFLLVIIFYQRKNSPFGFLFLRAWIIGGFLGLALILSVLIFTRSLSDYIHQCVVWAFGAYANPTHKDFKLILIGILLLLLFPICYLVFCGTYKICSKLSTSFQKVLFSLFLGFSFALISLTKITHKSFLNPVYDFVFFFQNYFSVLGYSSVMVMILLVYRGIKKKSFDDLTTPEFWLAISIIIQLYPVHDAMHIYWITPVTLAAIAPYLKELENIGFEKIENNVKIVCIGLIAGNAITLASYVAIPRVDAKVEILSGMRGTIESLQMIEGTIKSIESVPKTSSVIFECGQALYSVSNGSYIPKSFQLVDWGPVSNQKITAGDYILRCNQTILDIEKMKKSQNSKIRSQVKTLDDRYNILLEIQESR